MHKKSKVMSYSIAKILYTCSYDSFKLATEPELTSIARRIDVEGTILQPRSDGKIVPHE